MEKLSLKDAAAYMRVRMTTVYFWTRTGRLTTYRDELHRRHKYVLKAQVDELLDRTTLREPPKYFRKSKNGNSQGHSEEDGASDNHNA